MRSIAFQAFDELHQPLAQEFWAQSPVVAIVMHSQLPLSGIGALPEVLEKPSTDINGPDMRQSAGRYDLLACSFLLHF